MEKILIFLRNNNLNISENEFEQLRQWLEELNAGDSLRYSGIDKYYKYYIINIDTNLISFRVEKGA